LKTSQASSSGKDPIDFLRQRFISMNKQKVRKSDRRGDSERERESDKRGESDRERGRGAARERVS
jgi:hypothetical protein